MSKTLKLPKGILLITKSYFSIGCSCSNPLFFTQTLGLLLVVAVKISAVRLSFSIAVIFELGNILFIASTNFPLPADGSRTLLTLNPVSLKLSMMALQTSCGNRIETVFIPEEGRGTLCVSSQIGCALACSFCSTAQQGFNRNLTTAEIIGQVIVAQKRLGDTKKVTNVVMMGMGEPLLNFDNVVAAMNLMMDDFTFGLSKRRVTISTSGVVPAMYRLTEACDVSLAVSLHAVTNELRDVLVPINKKYPLAELMDACRDNAKIAPRRTVTFEYVMLEGINDSMDDARGLIKLLKNVPSKLNLIPFNPFPNNDYRCSSKEVIHRFKTVLNDAGIVTTVRKTRGDDIDAACGQLVGQVEDKSRRHLKLKALGITSAA